MSRKNKGILLLGSIGILCIAVAIIYAAVNASPNLTQEEALSIVQAEYEGEIIEAKQQGNHYIVTLATLAGTYEITVPKRGGGIENIAKLESQTESTIVAVVDKTNNDKQLDSSGQPVESVETKETVKATDSSNEASPSSTSKPSEASDGQEVAVKQNEKVSNNTKPVPSATTAAIVSEKKASDIALKQVAGEIDDIDLHSQGDQRYYLIEIESSDGQDAVVQIHAVTGKVMSISWDNDESDDDDDN